jgi:AcrR family transcriptional regulator
MKKQPEVTALTRKNLIQAFWNLYCQKKVNDISIKEITDKAGYHRSTFYEYFLDINDVLDQVEDELLRELKERAFQIYTAQSNKDFIQIVTGLYAAQGEYLRVLLGENGDPHFIKKVKIVLCPFLMRLYGLPENDIHTTYILEFGLSAIMSTITHWYQSEIDPPSNEMLILVRSMLMNGVFPMVQKYSTLPFKSGV